MSRGCKEVERSLLYNESEKLCIAFSDLTSSFARIPFMVEHTSPVIIERIPDLRSICADISAFSLSTREVRHAIYSALVGIMLRERKLQ